MKCEIITIISDNYGNRLQNYALQEVLKKMNINVFTNNIVKHVLLTKIKMIIKSIIKRNSADYFSLFNLKNIKWKYITNMNSINDNDIDFYIAGSDQIWNPNFSFNSDREFLTFCDPNKRIAYAASIGLSKLPCSQINRFTTNLKEFKNISMRENEGANIVSNLIGSKPQVVLDPTMLLTDKEWSKIVSQSKVKIKSPFIVKYYLGIRNESIENEINRFAKENGYKIIDIMNNNENIKIGPAEFLYLLKNSKYNFVDSFHGSVFSIIFKNSFLTFNRPLENGTGDMNSRFNTLFSMFEINDRYCTSEYININMLAPIDYNKVDMILNSKRSESIQFLQKSMNI